MLTFPPEWGDTRLFTWVVINNRQEETISLRRLPKKNFSAFFTLVFNHDSSFLHFTAKKTKRVIEVPSIVI